jgi:nicotinic acid mononucleotide adenylyltransferase
MEPEVETDKTDAATPEMWPRAVMNSLKRKMEGSPPNASSVAVILTTGAMNPAHRGHAQLLHQAAARLEAAGYKVAGAYLSPTHDEYVQPKARRLKTVGLSNAFRLEVARRTVLHDDLVALSPWECSQDDFVDFPQVSKACEMEFAAEAKVFYACGTDHASRCGLLSGFRGSTSNIGIVVVPRDGDRKPKEVPGKVWVAEPASGEVAEFSSTKVRAAIETSDFDYISRAMSPEAAQFLLKPSPEERERFSSDFDKLRKK